MIESFPIADPEIASQSWSRWFGKLRSEINKNNINIVNTAIIANVLTLDLGMVDFNSVVLTANITSIKFINVPQNGIRTIQFTQGVGPFTVAWPVSFKWVGGAASVVSVANGAIDMLTITTFNGGVAWKASLTKAWA